MRIIIDNRERELYAKCEAILNSYTKPSYIQLESAVLPLGDIYFKTDEGKDVLIIERKSFSDMLSSIKDGRYKEQSHRLLHSSGLPPHSIFYLLEGMFSQLKNPVIEKKLLISTMTSLQYFKGYSLIRTASVHETAEWILYMGDKIEREYLKGNPPYYLTAPFLKLRPTSSQLRDILPFSKSTVVEKPDVKEQEQEQEQENPEIKESEQENKMEYCDVVKKIKKDNITPENIGSLLLCNIPSVSSVTAIAIMKPFPTFQAFMEEMKRNPKYLETVTYDSNGKKPRKINKPAIENINKYLFTSSSNL